MQAILKNLRFVGQQRVLVMNVPPELAELPRALMDAGASVETVPAGAYRWSIVFVTTLEDVKHLVTTASQLIENDGILWLGYPKETSAKCYAGLTREKIDSLLKDAPVRVVAQTAIGGAWSAVRLRKAEYVS